MQQALSDSQKYNFLSHQVKSKPLAKYRNFPWANGLYNAWFENEAALDKFSLIVLVCGLDFPSTQYLQKAYELSWAPFFYSLEKNTCEYPFIFLKKRWELNLHLLAPGPFLHWLFEKNWGSIDTPQAAHDLFVIVERSRELHTTLLSGVTTLLSGVIPRASSRANR